MGKVKTKAVNFREMQKLAVQLFPDHSKRSVTDIQADNEPADSRDSELFVNEWRLSQNTNNSQHNSNPPSQWRNNQASAHSPEFFENVRKPNNRQPVSNYNSPPEIDFGDLRSSRHPETYFQEDVDFSDIRALPRESPSSIQSNAQKDNSLDFAAVRSRPRDTAFIPQPFVDTQEEIDFSNVRSIPRNLSTNIQSDTHQDDEIDFAAIRTLPRDASTPSENPMEDSIDFSVVRSLPRDIPFSNYSGKTNDNLDFSDIRNLPRDTQSSGLHELHNQESVDFSDVRTMPRFIPPVESANSQTEEEIDFSQIRTLPREISPLEQQQEDSLDFSNIRSLPRNITPANTAFIQDEELDFSALRLNNRDQSSHIHSNSEAGQDLDFSTIRTNAKANESSKSSYHSEEQDLDFGSIRLLPRPTPNSSSPTVSTQNLKDSQSDSNSPHNSKSNRFNLLSQKSRDSPSNQNTQNHQDEKASTTAHPSGSPLKIESDNDPSSEDSSINPSDHSSLASRISATAIQHEQEEIASPNSSYPNSQRTSLITETPSDDHHITRTNRASLNDFSKLNTSNVISEEQDNMNATLFSSPTNDQQTNEHLSPQSTFQTQASPPYVSTEILINSPSSENNKSTLVSQTPIDNNVILASPKSNQASSTFHSNFNTKQSSEFTHKSTRWSNLDSESNPPILKDSASTSGPSSTGKPSFLRRRLEKKQSMLTSISPTNVSSLPNATPFETPQSTTSETITPPTITQKEFLVENTTNSFNEFAKKQLESMLNYSSTTLSDSTKDNLIENSSKLNTLKVTPSISPYQDEGNNFTTTSPTISLSPQPLTITSSPLPQEEFLISESLEATQINENLKHTTPCENRIESLEATQINENSKQTSSCQNKLESHFSTPNAYLENISEPSKESALESHNETTSPSLNISSLETDSTQDLIVKSTSINDQSKSVTHTAPIKTAPKSTSNNKFIPKWKSQINNTTTSTSKLTENPLTDPHSVVTPIRAAQDNTNYEELISQDKTVIKLKTEYNNLLTKLNDKKKLSLSNHLLFAYDFEFFKSYRESISIAFNQASFDSEKIEYEFSDELSKNGIVPLSVFSALLIIKLASLQSVEELYYLVSLCKRFFKLLLTNTEVPNPQLVLLQETIRICHALGYPVFSPSTYLIECLWDALLTFNIVEESKFLEWYEDKDDESPGRIDAIFQLMAWFKWLVTPEYEGEEILETEACN